MAVNAQGCGQSTPDPVPGGCQGGGRSSGDRLAETEGLIGEQASHACGQKRGNGQLFFLKGGSFQLKFARTDNVKGRKILNTDLLHPVSNPISSKGGIAVLKGNLAEEGADLKVKAAGGYEIRIIRHGIGVPDARRVLGVYTAFCSQYSGSEISVGIKI